MVKIKKISLVLFVLMFVMLMPLIMTGCSLGDVDEYKARIKELETEVETLTTTNYELGRNYNNLKDKMDNSILFIELEQDVTANIEVKPNKKIVILVTDNSSYLYFDSEVNISTKVKMLINNEEFVDYQNVSANNYMKPNIW